MICRSVNDLACCTIVGRDSGWLDVCVMPLLDAKCTKITSTVPNGCRRLQVVSTPSINILQETTATTKKLQMCIVENESEDDLEEQEKKR